MASTVLVLDGDERAALAVTRNLGRHGIRIIVGSHVTEPLAGASRWCQAVHRLPDPSIDIEGLLGTLATIVADERPAAIFPLTDATLTALGAVASIGDAVVARAPEAAYSAASDKASLAIRAKELGVPVPRTEFVSTAEECRSALMGWQGPVVIKPAVSKYIGDNRIVSTSVIIAKDARDALEQLPEMDWLGAIDGLLQEYIPGRGAGVFTIYGPTDPLAWFAHRRIREKPPGGGVSVLCESAPIDSAMQDYAAKLLDDLDWLGPAMVEFRIDETGAPWLMEINGRFWGSLQLSIDSGIEFPWLWYEVAMGTESGHVNIYRPGRRLRWLLGDVDSLYLTLRESRSSRSQKAAAILRFLNFFDPRTKLEVLRLSDPKPFLRELSAWLRALIRR